MFYFLLMCVYIYMHTPPHICLCVCVCMYLSICVYSDYMSYILWDSFCLHQLSSHNQLTVPIFTLGILLIWIMNYTFQICSLICSIKSQTPQETVLSVSLQFHCIQALCLVVELNKCVWKKMMDLASKCSVCVKYPFLLFWAGGFLADALE